MVRRGSFIGGQDNLSVPDAPTIGAATVASGQVSVAFTAPSDVGDDPITSFGASVFPATGTTKTFRVTVASGNLYGGGTGNVFYIDGVSNPALTLVKGFTYVFDQEDSSNSGHPFHFKNSSDSQYTTGVTVSGTAGSSGATVTLVLAEDASEPSAYYCTAHGNGMGNTITLVAPSASDDPLGQAQYTNTGSSSPITVTGLSNGTPYVAKVWAINDYGNGPLSAATSSFTPALNRAILVGANTDATDLQRIDFVTVQTTGNATDFGNATGSVNYPDAAGSDTRTIIYESGTSTYTDIISYVTIASTGNATDFGDLSVATGYVGAASNNVRSINTGGVINAGGGTYQNRIEYLTIATTGDVTDFGDLLGTFLIHGSAASTTRIVTGGGFGLLSGGASNVYHVTVQYNTIASAGNSSDFGDLTVGRTSGALASATRAVFGPGDSSGTNTMDYITIASTGNATDFGDSTITRNGAGGTADSTRGLFFGGGGKNVIDYITIASTGNATDFGDLTQQHTQKSGGHSSDVAAAQNESYFAPAAMGLFAGGVGSGTTIEYIDIASTGDTAMFGDLSVARSYVGATASSTRSVHAGGYTGSSQDVIDFVLFSTKGIATDFGNLLSATYSVAGAGSNTRGIFSFSTPRSNVIQYITIASAGNATDFGDKTVSVESGASASSQTRTVMAGGFEASDDVDVIDYVTTASTGNATDFGNLSTGASQMSGAVSSNTRAVFALGRTYSGGSSTTVNTLEYITIASTGNVTDFGDLSVARYLANAVSSSTRGVFSGGVASSGVSNVMDYITIASTGNATDFGDIISQPYAHGGSSNSHGGLS